MLSWFGITRRYAAKIFTARPVDDLNPFSGPMTPELSDALLALGSTMTTSDTPAMDACADWCCLKGCVQAHACRCEPKEAWCTCGARAVRDLQAQVQTLRHTLDEVVTNRTHRGDLSTYD